VSLRLLREGYAPHSMGTLLGLRGVVPLLPLYAAVAVLVVHLLTPTRRYAVKVALAVVLATVAVSQYRRLANTPQGASDATWQFVTRTYEP